MTMCKTYAAKRLLEHGHLSMAQFKEITGWKQKQAHSTMQQLVRTGVARQINQPCLRHATKLFGLASSSSADGCEIGMKTTEMTPTNTTGSNCHG